MTSQGRRVLRIFCKGGLLICLPLTGFVWALPSEGGVLSGAVVLTVISIALGFAAEVLAASNEAELTSLGAQYEIDQKRRAEELERRDEKLRQHDRVVALLTEQNNSFRANLISLQVEMQQRYGVLRKFDEEPRIVEEMPPDVLKVARAG